MCFCDLCQLPNMNNTKTSSINEVIQGHKRELIAFVFFLLTYVPTFMWMWDRWWARDSYYSHGILVPFVTGYLIWQKRSELKALKKECSPWGLPLIILGLTVHILSSLFRVYFTSGFSSLVVLIGLILYFYGARVLKAIFFPVFFLIFMLPAPEVVITNISFRMKIFVAQISAGTLNSIGIFASRDGSMIKMPHANVVVDDVCSGLRSLITLTALGSIFAYLMTSKMIKRILLFLSTIPIAVITNVCRVIFLSLISEIWGVQYASGLVHDIAGFMLFGLAFLLLFAVGRLLE